MPKGHLSSWECREFSPIKGRHLSTSNFRGFALIKESHLSFYEWRVFRVKTYTLVAHSTKNTSVIPLVNELWIDYWIVTKISASTSILAHSLLVLFLSVLTRNLLGVGLTLLKLHYHSPYTNTSQFLSPTLAIQSHQILHLKIQNKRLIAMQARIASPNHLHSSLKSWN